MTGCIGEPVSWLRLERYGLGELPEGERVVVESHLRACAVCEACYRQIADAGDGGVVLPLVAAGAREGRAARVRWRRWAGVAAATLAAAAGVVLSLRGPGLEPPDSRRVVKGGEIRIELVRMGADGRLREADGFSPGDRFKVLLTCPPPWRGFADLVVYQGGRAHFPLEPQTIEECGNRRGLEGAFQLDGEGEVVVCVAMAERGVDRGEIKRGVEGLPEWSVCERLSRVP